MKNNTKNIAKVVVALVAAVLMFFSSLSSVVSAVSREVKEVVNVVMENIEVPVTNILEKTVPIGCYAAVIPAINTATILVDKTTETTNTVSQLIQHLFINQKLIISIQRIVIGLRLVKRKKLQVQKI